MTNRLPRKILIAGAGSVGKRHARNFSSLSCFVAMMDPRPDRLAEISREIPLVDSFGDFETALGDDSWDAVVICSPPHVHVEQAAKAIKRSIPVLLEKPVSPRLSEAEDLLRLQQKTKVSVLLGYTWRWWPPLARVRHLLREGAIGKPLHVRFVMSAHLADWHPWENYTDFFMASASMGGGALLDESHWVDLCCWLFGMPSSVLAEIGRISDLQIETDDNVDMVMTYQNGLKVTLHLDLFGRPHEKSITFVGENGTLRWSAEPNEILIGRSISDWSQREVFTCERNDMFMAVAAEFISMLDGVQHATCSLEDGVNVLRVLEAARESSGSGRRVALQGWPVQA